MAQLTRRGLLPLLSASVLSAGVDWSRFRGPNGGGVAEEESPPVRFGPDENVVWTTALPPGKSSPALTADRIFLTAHEDETLLTLCLDRTTGKILWRRPAPSRRLEKLNRLNDEACATPVTDGENVYVFFGGYGLLGYGPDGEELWRRAARSRSRISTAWAPLRSWPTAASSCSAIKIKRRLPHRARPRDSGETRVEDRTARRWFIASRRPRVYKPRRRTARKSSRPAPTGLTGYDAETRARSFGAYAVSPIKSNRSRSSTAIASTSTAGRPEASPPSASSCRPSTQALEQLDADGDRMLSKTGDPAGAWQPGNWDMQDLDKNGVFDARDWLYYTRRRTSSNSTMAVRLGGAGDVTDTHLLWRHDKSLPDVPAVLLYRDVLYLIRNGGILQTLDPDSGRVLYQGRVREAIDSYYASPVAADGKIYLVSEKGLAAVLRAGATPETLAVNDLGEEAYATPAIADSRIYLRTASRLYCFG